MPQNENGKPQASGNKDIAKNLSLKTYWVSISVASLIVLVILGIVAHFRVNEHSESIRFFTVNTLSWLVFVAVVTQIIIYKKQWEVMQETLKEMRISRELENRAWIGVTAIDLQDAKGGGVEIVATFVNSGNSPAIVKVEYGMEVREESPPDNIVLGPFPDQGSTLAFFPHTERKSQLARLRAIPLPERPKSPSHTYYIYGSLRYEDIFQQRHTTHFCYQAELVEIGGKKAVVLAVAPTHNTFD